MKKLHLVGFTKDKDGLILSPRKGAKSGGYVVALDDQLVSSIEQARRQDQGEAIAPPGDGAPDSPSPAVDTRRARPRSALSPREIQARLRAGSTIAAVAAQAGVEEEWVLRFADPILAEQAQVVESAQRLTFAKSRLGPSAEPLGQAVQWNLTDRGVRFSDDVFSDCWSAFNLHGARWAVRFTYTSRQRRQMAEWEVDLRERSLTARNRLASDLGHVEPGRRRPRLEPQDQGQLEAIASGPPAGDARHRPGARATAARPGRAAASTKVPGNASSAGAPAAGSDRTTAAGAKALASRASSTRSAAPAAKAPAKAPGRRSASTPPVAKRTTAKRTAAKTSSAARPAARTTAKKAGRESAPRKSRPPKKPAADKPGGEGPSTAAAPPGEAFPDRPSHLARPPSPMNMANRASSLPGRRFGTAYQPAPPRAGAGRIATSSRPSPPPSTSTARVVDTGETQPSTDSPPAPEGPPARPSRSGAVRRPDRLPADTASPAGSSRAAGREGGRGPARPDTGAARASPDVVPRPVAPPLRTTPSATASDGGNDDQRPAVVILSTPPSSAPPRVTARRAGAGSAGRGDPTVAQGETPPAPSAGRRPGRA